MNRQPLLSLAAHPASIIALTILVFVLDYLAPVELAVWIWYLVPLLLTYFLPKHRAPIYFSVLLTILTVVDFILTATPNTPYYIPINRILGLSIMWAFALAMCSRKKAYEEMNQAVMERHVAESQREAAVEARAHSDAAALGAMAGQQWLEEQLLARELQLSSIIESAMDAIITVDNEQRVVLFNRAAEKMFQCPAAEALGHPLDRFIPQRYREAHRDHIWALGGPGVTNRMTRTLNAITGLRANGEEFEAEAAISKAEVKGAQFYSVILRDITERKRMEEALRESEGRFRMFMDHSPAIAWIKNEQGGYVYVNAPFARLLGKPVDDIIGRTDMNFWPPEIAQQFQDNDARVLASGEQLETTELSPGSGGEIRHWMVLKFPIQEVSGRRYVGGMAMEFTERKKLEEQLRQTERLAEVGTLAAGLAHEIGTPMNVILGRAEQLMRKSESDVVRNGLATIVSQVERITKIMNQLLTFARRKPSERARVNIGQIAEDCLEVLQDRLRRTGITVQSDFETTLHPVHAYADPDQISQVFLNLFINAIHAMPDGGTLRLSITSAGGLTRILVTDTGHGIPAEDLPKIFTPFFTTKEVGKGTGLGLTVVHYIIQEHGGSISVESTPGQGTTFTITLPTDQA